MMQPFFGTAVVVALVLFQGVSATFPTLESLRATLNTTAIQPAGGNDDRRKLARRCKSDKERCRSTSRCCPGLDCMATPRITNKQNHVKVQRRCIDPTQPQTLPLGRNKFCKKELDKCIIDDNCCPGLECAPVERVRNRQGGRASETRCVKPDMPPPVLKGKFEQWKYRDLLENEESFPFAIGSLTVAPGSRALLNTVKATKKGFALGMRTVSVDAALTANGELIAYGFDTIGPMQECTTALTIEEIKDKGGPQIDLLRDILQVARGRSFVKDSPDEPRGLLTIYMSHGASACEDDPAEEQFDRDMAQALVKVLREADMMEQVMIISVSGPLIKRIKELEPQLLTSLGVSSTISLLTPEQLLVLLEPLRAFLPEGVPLLVEYERDGRPWYSLLGGEVRAPFYESVGDAFALAQELEVDQVALEMEFFNTSDTAAGTALVSTVESMGFRSSVWGCACALFNENTDAETLWKFLTQIGLDSTEFQEIKVADNLQAEWV